MRLHSCTCCLAYMRSFSYVCSRLYTRLFPTSCVFCVLLLLSVLTAKLSFTAHSTAPPLYLPCELYVSRISRRKPAASTPDITPPNRRLSTVLTATCRLLAGEGVGRSNEEDVQGGGQETLPDVDETFKAHQLRQAKRPKTPQIFLVPKKSRCILDTHLTFTYPSISTGAVPCV